MFLWHYPYCSFLSLFIFFAYAYKARNEGHPSHLLRKSDKQRGFRA